jgi:hypothetical protein
MFANDTFLRILVIFYLIDPGNLAEGFYVFSEVSLTGDSVEKVHPFWRF